MADLKLDNVSVIVVSEGNNPRIINPDFLRRTEVIPSDFGVSETIVTPPLSLVRYDNGLAIQMEEHKLSFVAIRPNEIEWLTLLPTVTNRLLEVLPHVGYKAVGLNFKLSSEAVSVEKAEAELIESLLAKGEWFNFDRGLTGAVVEFHFHNSQPQLNVKVAVKEETRDSGESFSEVFLTANFHQDFSTDEVEMRSAFISDLGRYERELQQFGRLLPLFSGKKLQ
ncbi:hypothetical protein [Nitrosospira sp. Is2]|uniref:hypothetical protein n=1 Tax=Nitrosospira sp. Is2 TaxID=3080532 RepID=UPI002955955A|nr:hypothetical protein [Nitrosospira sp. Is2]WON75231.1 hypothetical protein R5L00_07075 [Nitrosospira sp. Is2]